MYETLTRFLSGFVLEGENRRREQDLSEEITKFLNAHREYQLPEAKIPVPGTDSSLLDGKEVVGMLQSASRGEVPSLLRRLQVLDGQRPVSDDHLTMPVTGFYHEYDEPYGAFSNWYPASFTYAGIPYANSEQYMMYQKMAMFGAADQCRRIMESSDPKKCKKIGGERIQAFSGPLWDRLKGHIMERGLLSKFASNPTLADLLLSTGDDLLCESLNNRRLTDARFADERRVVLLAAAKNLNQAFDFAATADNRVKFTLLGERRQVATEMIQNRSLGTGLATNLLACIATALVDKATVITIIGTISRSLTIHGLVLDLLQGRIKILVSNAKCRKCTRGRRFALLQNG